MLRASLLSAAFFAAFITAQGFRPDLPPCPDTTDSATIAWLEHPYSHESPNIFTVIDGQDDVTTYAGIECADNAIGMTIAVGDNTFSLQRVGWDADGSRVTMVDECMSDSERMVCTMTADGLLAYSAVTTFLDEDLYDTTIALAASGSFTLGTPTMASQPYTGCPDNWFGCENLNGWCCPQDYTCTTLSVAGNEACATGANDDFPAPALPSITEIAEDMPSTGGMPGFPRATQVPEMVVGGLLGLAVALL